jgi:sulfide:quinone oxidoreductase
MRPLRVVVVGAGVAAIETCLALRALAGSLVDIAMVAPDDELEFKPASVGEPFGVSAVRRFDLARIARDVGAELIRGTASAVEVDRREVLIDGWHPISYDALVVAAGAEPLGAVPGATTFAGPRDVPVVRAVIEEVAEHPGSRLVFAIPAASGWTLPAYELGLLAATHLLDRAHEPSHVAVVSPEVSPLHAFGAAASAEVGRLLERRGVAFLGLRTPIEVRGGMLHTSPSGSIHADRVIALPKLRGVRIDGLPANADGLVRIDRCCRVDALADVYAAGDITDFPIKQGGIAAQQADVVAECIASDAGAAVRPRPFRPQLRGLLLTGDEERYLTAEIAGGRGDTSAVEEEPAWWPPVKIPARFLGPYLAGLDAERRVQAGAAGG